MEIKAIETEYKGYRFRSRLEARWAVFFDALEVKWEYETEGYEKDGVKYLPDFYLPESRMFAEIKPYADHIPYPQIYLAGKIQLYHDWRDIIHEDLKDRYERYNIVGPSYIDHNDNNDDIVSTCFDEVDSATLVYANFETADTPGTLIELGYAHAKGKTIIARFATEEICTSLWFVRGFIKEYFVGGNAVDPLDGYLPKLTEAFKKCRMLPGDKFVAMMQGDPGDCTLTVFSYGGENDWKKELKQFCRVFLNRTASQVDYAIKKARSARFEFGEKG